MIYFIVLRITSFDQVVSALWLVMGTLERWQCCTKFCTYAGVLIDSFHYLLLICLWLQN